MPTPIKIQATKLEIPYSLSQLDTKKNEIAALVESLGLTFEGEQNLYNQLIALGIEQTKEGEQYDSIDVSKSAGVVPVNLKISEQPQVGLSVDTSNGTAIVAVEPSPSLEVSIEPAKQIDVVNEQPLIVSLTNKNITSPTGGGGAWGSITGDITNQTDLVTYVNRAVPQFTMTSQDGTEFTIVVTNDGQLLVIPEGSTAPTIIGIPTISGTEAVWYTLLAVPAAVTGSPTPERAWQWQRSSNGTDWVDITGATSISYLLVDLDGNNYIRVKQSESNVLGTATAESASTGVIFPSQFSTTQWQNISPVFWEQLTTQTWN